MDADLVRLAQAVSNLLDNAVKYSSRPGSIDVSARREAGEALIAVRDRGDGIAPELLPRVFDLFAQGESPSQPGNSGLGLGLTLVRQIVEQHGGKVSVASPGLGKGSEFTISLPLAAPELGISLAGSLTESRKERSHAQDSSRPAEQQR